MAVSISLQLFVPLYKIQQYFIFAKTMASEILKIEIQNLLESTMAYGMARTERGQRGTRGSLLPHCRKNMPAFKTFAES